MNCIYGPRVKKRTFSNPAYVIGAELLEHGRRVGKTRIKSLQRPHQGERGDIRGDNDSRTARLSGPPHSAAHPADRHGEPATADTET